MKSNIDLAKIKKSTFDLLESSGQQRNLFLKELRKILIKSKYIIKPGELVLGITVEKITLPGNICGWLNSRSRFFLCKLFARNKHSEKISSGWN